MATLLCYKRADGRWAWRLTSGSDIVATDGGQGYENYTDCQAMADKVVITGGFKDAERTKSKDDG